TPEVMNRTLESIRNRVDAFGVGEPAIFVTGTNIEVQIPGLANGTVQARSVQQTCLIGASAKNFGCYDSPSAASDALKGIQPKPQQTGHDRLIKIIGTTARLEERQVTETIAPGDPQYQSTPVTCGTVAEQSQPKCSFSSLEHQPVVYLGPGNVKYQLGPVEIT